MKSRILIIVAIAGLFAFAPLAKAADNVISGLIISPPIKEMTTQPGAPFSDVIRVTNPNSSTALKIDVTIEDFQAQGEDGQQTFIEPNSNNTFSMGNWISVDKSFTLKGDETKEIPYTVNVPKNAEPGGHYGVIFFSPSLLNPETLTGSGVMAVPKVGSLLLVNIPGDIKYSGKIAEFGISKKLYIDSKNTISFLTRFQNLSSSHVKPHGDIVITNTLGKNVATIPVNDKLGNVLPDSIRRFENQWQNKYGFGLYKANINLIFGDNQTVSAVLSFWIIPWKETAGVLALFIILIFIIRHLRWSNKPDESSEVPPLNTQNIPPQNIPLQDNPPQNITPQNNIPPVNPPVPPTINQETPISPQDMNIRE